MKDAKILNFGTLLVVFVLDLEAVSIPQGVLPISSPYSREI